jgi:hypothetical protein
MGNAVIFSLPGLGNRILLWLAAMDALRLFTLP